MLTFNIKGEVKNKKALFLKFQGMPVEYIDGLPTAIKSEHKNFKKGFIIQDDLSKKPCFIASFGNYFAHGKTLKEALEIAKNKYWVSKNTEERLCAFEKTFDKNKKYKNSEFFKWHNILTGSCLTGRESFCRNKNISLEDKSTPLDFIELCKNDFGGNIISQLYKKHSGDDSGYGDGSGDDSGYGYGYGDGSGYGDGYGYGDGDGDGSGDGSGYGSGYGDGDGSGDDSGSGYGYGYGDGSGYGDGYGYGDGDGSGYGYGDGDGDGSGSDSGSDSGYGR